MGFLSWMLSYIENGTNMKNKQQIKQRIQAKRGAHTRHRKKWYTQLKNTGGITQTQESHFEKIGVAKTPDIEFKKAKQSLFRKIFKKNESKTIQKNT